jgi:hypothetical protein
MKLIFGHIVKMCLVYVWVGVCRSASEYTFPLTNQCCISALSPDQAPALSSLLVVLGRFLPPEAVLFFDFFVNMF